MTTAHDDSCTCIHCLIAETGEGDVVIQSLLMTDINAALATYSCPAPCGEHVACTGTGPDDERWECKNGHAWFLKDGAWYPASWAAFRDEVLRVFVPAGRFP